jgi:hypothetical protein
MKERELNYFAEQHFSFDFEARFRALSFLLSDRDFSGPSILICPKKCLTSGLCNIKQNNRILIFQRVHMNITTSAFVGAEKLAFAHRNRVGRTYSSSVRSIYVVRSPRVCSSYLCL